MVTDEARQQVVLFGGANGGPNGRQYLADTWTWNGTTWTSSPSTTAPSPRAGAAIGYDPARSRVVLFGGCSGWNCGTLHDDTWEWDGSSWTRMTSTRAPARRSASCLAFDGRTLVLFGGSGAGNATLGDTWTWDGTEWREVTAQTSPLPRSSHACVFDGRSLVLVGGRLVGVDVWRFESSDGGHWSANPPATPTPQARQRYGLMFEPATGDIVYVGGRTGRVFGDTWVLRP